MNMLLCIYRYMDKTSQDMTNLFKCYAKAAAKHMLVKGRTSRKKSTFLETMLTESRNNICKTLLKHMFLKSEFFMHFRIFKAKPQKLEAPHCPGDV